jgi:hypothetical protein
MVDFAAIIKQLITERDRINSAIAALEGINGASPKNPSGKRTLGEVDFAVGHR